MLRFPGYYGFNDKAADCVENFMNDNIKSQLLMVIDCYENKKNNGFALYYPNMLEEFFPENFPREYCLDIMKALYALLNASKSFVPTLIMEYVMSRIIEMGINNYEDYHIVISNMSPQYDYPEGVEKSLYEYYKDMAYDIYDEDELTDGFIQSYVQSHIDNLSHFSEEWLEACFWDWDFTLLNDMSMGEIRHSLINEACGVMSPEASDDAYYMPKDWRNSKDFHYLNK